MTFIKITTLQSSRGAESNIVLNTAFIEQIGIYKDYTRIFVHANEGCYDVSLEQWTRIEPLLLSESTQAPDLSELKSSYRQWLTDTSSIKTIHGVLAAVERVVKANES